MIKHKYNGKGFSGYIKKKLPYQKDFLVSLYRDMLRIRLVEEEIERRYHENEMKSPIHLVIGQEAISVGSCAALRKEDLAFCGHRTQGIYLAKGGDLKGMMSELYCRKNGCAGSRGGSMHLFDKSVGMESSSAIVAGSIPNAVGAALTAQLKRTGQVCASFLGDASIEEGVFWESLNFAALKKLPVIFICENNFFSVCSPIEARQPDAKIYKKAAGFGVPSVQIDGTNILEVYESTQKAVQRSRQGKGPSFIEAIAYRWRGHGGAYDDSHTGYRDQEEVEHWKKFCPVQTYFDFLCGKNIFGIKEQEVMIKDLQNEILEAFNHAISSPEPEKEDLYRHVYSD